MSGHKINERQKRIDKILYWSIFDLDYCGG
jgi:hypothetical protein